MKLQKIMMMIKQKVNPHYSNSFENLRRLHPRFYDVDYCLLIGLVEAVKKFSSKHVKPGMKVVDFGCGAKPYRTLFPDDCDYIGIDTCSSPYANLVIEPGSQVPLSDQSVDCILSTQVFYLIPEYGNYLNECCRILKPDGYMLVTTHGTWTHHPASGGDYYRFTQDGLQYVLNKAGFEIEDIQPIVGTLGAGLHLRQLIFNSWLRRIPFIGGSLIAVYNILINLRILIEDYVQPIGTKMSSPVIFAAVARPRRMSN